MEVGSKVGDCVGGKLGGLEGATVNNIVGESVGLRLIVQVSGQPEPKQLLQKLFTSKFTIPSKLIAPPSLDIRNWLLLRTIVSVATNTTKQNIIFRENG